MAKKKIKYAKTDYLYSSLPNTRKDAFKDVYKHNFSTILKCGLFLLLLSLPLIAFLTFMDVGKMGMTLDHYTEEDLEGVLLLWDIIHAIGFVILFIPIVLALSAIMRILKLVIFQEGVDFFYDFKVGIKENFKNFFLIYLIFALLFLLTYLLQLFFIRQIIGIAILVLFFVIFLPMLFWIYLSINIYETRFWDYIKNGFFFNFKNILFSLLYLLMIIWPMVVCFLFSENIISIGVNIIYIAVKYLLLVVMAILYYPCLFIVALLFSCSKFDEYINKDQYPEIYRKGLYDPKDK